MDSWCPILFSGLSSATIFYLILKLSLIWPGETPSNWLGPPPMFPSSSEPFLAVWCDKMFQVHVLLSLPQPQTESFPQGALVPGSWTGYVEAKIWVLSRLMATGVSLLPGPFAYPHIHTHLQPYLFLFLPMQTASQEFTPVPFLPTQHHRVHSGFFPFASPTVWNLASVILVYSLIWPIPLHNQPVISTASLPPYRGAPLTSLWLRPALGARGPPPPLHSPTLLCPTPWQQDSIV